MQGWFLGSEAGGALADVLTGKVCPSGKLPFTWPESLNDVGAHALGTYPGTWRDPEKGPQEFTNIIDETYSEGIYVGYRWADKEKKKSAFAFGHGLSYTTFRLTDLRADRTELTRDGKITFTIRVTNTGTRDGAETVQLYVHDQKATVDRPYKELKAFKKVWLKAGESQDVTLTIDNSALSYYDETSGEWTSENGDFIALVGNASDKLTLKQKFTLK